ncbi:MAG: prepilin-type N-terminal cleavage/methylation domain-containing protein [Desulfobacula sp.]|nr:prepilin-type N-terminal cleavage/methylation domain-containing protein [Desulfobacula sp.]
MNNKIILFTKNNTNHLGFTLIELLMAMTITSIVSAGIFTAYQGQQNTQLAQKQTVEMQQNLRAALYIMTSEIRMAGFDPSKTNGAGIVSAGDGSSIANLLKFTYFNAAAAGDGNDNDNDAATADADETLQAIEYYLYDSLGDGTMDLGRRNGARLDAIAENIQTLQFAYLDIDGIVTANLSDMRSVQITVVATTDANEINRTNGNRTLSTTVKCRNLGL